jgi:hypothetical protein
MFGLNVTMLSDAGGPAMTAHVSLDPINKTSSSSFSVGGGCF